MSANFRRLVHASALGAPAAQAPSRPQQRALLSSRPAQSRPHNLDAFKSKGPGGVFKTQAWTLHLETSVGYPHALTAEGSFMCWQRALLNLLARAASIAGCLKDAVANVTAPLDKSMRRRCTAARCSERADIDPILFVPTKHVNAPTT